MTPQPTVAHWIPVRPHQMPPAGTQVCIAYAFAGDEELTEDQGEWDGERWYYTGGTPLPRNARIFFWAPAPQPPPRPEPLRRTA